MCHLCVCVRVYVRVCVYLCVYVFICVFEFYNLLGLCQEVAANAFAGLNGQLACEDQGK
jgi:hypothetical protein